MHKNYLIIGGSTGIGLAIVNQLKKDSLNVISTYYESDSFENTPNYHYLNVLDNNYDLDFIPDQLDGIVYCPGSINLAPFKRITKDSIIEDFELSVLGAFKIIQQLIPNLKKSEQGSIVLFSSVAAQNGFSFHTQVSIIKGAIEGFTKALAAELAPSIRVNAIAPSITQTPLASKLLNTEAKLNANANRHPLKKVGEANDIAHLAKFLLTEKSKWITGQILTIDGGISSLKI